MQNRPFQKPASHAAALRTARERDDLKLISCSIVRKRHMADQCPVVHRKKSRQGMGIEAMTDIDKVTQQDLIDFASRVHAKAQRADAVLVSCGGFRTLELIAPLEARTGVPVISSMPHGLWAGAKLVGLDGSAPGYGKLLSKT
jgi:Asp/Glu/hydantoin racemase